MKTTPIQTWFKEWNRWLLLWLEGGVANPSQKAQAHLSHWITQSQKAGWTEVSQMGQRLLDSSSSHEDKAEALLALCIYYETIKNQLNQIELTDKYKLT